MAEPARIVKLLKNEIYPTYQLYAQMAKKTPAQEGLRIGVRTVLDWLLLRLGENVPSDLQELASQEDPLFSYHVSSGFGIDIVSIPEQGTWTLQITEPDLGSDPGNPKQERQPVPGRVITSNIGFCINGSVLECGFQILMSDPEYAAEDAPVYRLAPVRHLLEKQDFGLAQITVLTETVTDIGTQDGLKGLMTTWHHEQNSIPCVVFTDPGADEEKIPDVETLSKAISAPRFGAVPSLPSELQVHASKLVSETRSPLDAEVIAKSCFTYCRTYRLSDSLFNRFKTAAGAGFHKGDVVILEPDEFGGAVRIMAYSPLKSKQAELISELKAQMIAYPRRKTYSFGNVAFLAAARQHLRNREEEWEQQAEETRVEWEQRLSLREAELRSDLFQAEEKIEELRRQTGSLKRYQAELERDKENLRRLQEEEVQKYQLQLRKRDEEIAYLRRKLTQPTDHEDIAEWVAKTFEGRLFMHQKAVALLEDKSAKTVQVSLICDALDFLATDYWDYRYERISREEMNTRCSEKYGRPFEIKPTGTMTVQFTQAQYKIKYFPGARGKPVESALDYHLCVGNDMENLLRVYFLHDDDKKLIVIGSLPRHLRAVTIQ